MRKRRIVLMVVMLLATLLLAGGAAVSTAENRTLTAELSSANAVPPVETNPQSQATFELGAYGTQLETQPAGISTWVPFYLVLMVGLALGWTRRALAFATK